MKRPSSFGRRAGSASSLLPVAAIAAAFVAACGFLASPGDYTSEAPDAAGPDGATPVDDGGGGRDVVVLPDGNVPMSRGTILLVAGERDATSQEDDPAWSGDVFAGVLDESGAVALWRSERSAPIIGAFDAVTVFDNRLFTLSFGFGIFAGRNHALQSIAFGPGITGDWRANRAAMPGGLDEIARAFVGTRVVTVGGSRTVQVDGGTNTFVVKETHIAPVDGAKNELGAFGDGPSLVVARARPGVLVTAARIIVAGGRAPVATGIASTVESAKIDPAQGTVEPFEAQSTMMAGGAEHRVVAPQMVTANDWVYLAGGRVANNTPTDVVLGAKLDANGALGPWQELTKLPKAIRDFAFVAHAGVVYVIGGQNADGRSDEVLSAPIQADGTLGPWASTNNAPLPVKRSDFVAVAYP